MFHNPSLCLGAIIFRFGSLGQRPSFKTPTSCAVSTTHELGFALGASLLSTAAGASLAGLSGEIGGFQIGFMVAAVVALVGAGLAFHLLPRERPDMAGRLLAH